MAPITRIGTYGFTAQTIEGVWGLGYVMWC
jgi:hypothetical protein